MRIAGLMLMLALTASAAAPPQSTVDVLTRGQQISTAVAAVTSTAISPLLGVCLLGIYDYERTAPEARGALPFYSRPHFWIPISILLVLLFFKDSIGQTVHPLKKPLDAIEVLVINKAALVLIAFPVMFHEVSRLTGIRDISELIQPVVYAAKPGNALEAAGHWGSAGIMLLAGTVITLVVWVVGHAADVLALLSPVPFVDLLVKVGRAAIMLTVAGCAILSPMLGLAASAVVIGICTLLFWLALKVLILGTVFAWDVLFFRTETPGNAVRAFTVGKIRGMPRLTLGSLTRDPNGILEFRYRTRRIRLEDASAYDVGRGVLYPTVVLQSKLQFRLLPRYRGSEEAVRAALGLAGVKETGLGKLVRGASPT